MRNSKVHVRIAIHTELVRLRKRISFNVYDNSISAFLDLIAES